MSPELTRRVAVAAIGIPIALGAAYLGGWVLAALLAVAAGIAASELRKIARAGALEPLPVLGTGGAVVLVGLAAMDPAGGPDGAGFAIFLILLGLMALGTAIWRAGVEGRPLATASVAVITALYCGGMLSHGLFLRHMPAVLTPADGLVVLALPVLLTWSNDTFAYFVGRRWGQRKLIPSVSPGKTVEGSIGGVLGTAAVAILYSVLLSHHPYVPGPFGALVLGLLVAAAAQIGDLVESLLKREAGVKDSGRILPGHGGVLDRVDSLLFVLPITYYFLLLTGA